MAKEFPVLDLTMLSSGDESLNQYKLVQATSADALGQFRVVAVRGDVSAGVLQDNSTQTRASSRVRTWGVSKVAAGDSSGGVAITEGMLLVASSKGQAVASSSGGLHVIGMAMDGLAANTTGIISALIWPGIALTS